jgi:signal transduction histidine kinase
MASASLLNPLRGGELRRLGFDLHHSTVQSLAALTANLDVVTMNTHTLDGRARQVLEDSASIARECFQQLLALADLLCPPPVDEVVPLDTESSSSKSTGHADRKGLYGIRRRTAG